MSAEPPVGRRVALALGTWQLVVLLAALAQCDERGEGAVEEHLVLYGPGLPAAMRTAMLELAAGERRWTTITWADELLVKPVRPGGSGAVAVAALADRLADHGLTRPGDVDELWLCKLQDFPEKVAAELFGAAAIQLYEDGMHFYVRQPTIRGADATWDATLRSSPRRAARWVIGRGDAFWTPGVWAGHLARVRSWWTVLPASSGIPLDVPRRTEIAARHVRGQLAATAGRWGTGSIRPAGDRPLAIVLGQAFARFGLIAEEEERRIYRDVCADLLDNGFEVRWKDHPRLPDGLADRLFDDLRDAGPISALEIGSAWPVEAAVAELGPAALVSGTSTSLFVAAALFGTSCSSFADELRFSPVRRDHRWMARLAADTFPPPRHAWRTFAGSVPGIAA